MEFRQLKAFYTVANTKSFTQAAEILGYAQSSITTQIQLLEQELDTKLFERLSRQIMLTEAGKCFLNYTIQILNLSLAAKQAVCSISEPEGALIIGAPESLCATRLPLVLKEYRSLYPKVQIMLKVGACNEFYQWLKSNIVDVAFFFQKEFTHPELIAAPLIAEPMVLVAAKGHRLIKKGAVRANDLQGETLILAERDCTYRMIMENILLSAGVHPEVVLEFSSVAAMKQCAVNGLGITLLPEIAVSAELKEAQLVDLNWAGADFNIVTQIVYHKDKWLSPALSKFISLANQMLKI